MFRRFVVLIAATLPIAGAADVKVVEEIAAKVNGDIITRSELDQQRRELEQQLHSEGLTGAKLTDAVKQNAANALRDEIDQLLLVQKGQGPQHQRGRGRDARSSRTCRCGRKITDPDKFHQLIQQQTG